MAEYLDPFAYHKPDGEQTERIEMIRKDYYELLCQVRLNTKLGSVSGRYVALAKTALEESAMWATKAVVFENNNDPEKET